MAIIKAAARLIVDHARMYRYEDPVLCLGVPDIYLTHEELRRACDAIGLRAAGPDRSREFVSAAVFFRALGLSELVSVDIPGAHHPPDCIHNLNEPLPPELTARFNLVVDPATMEHVFDVRSGLSNVVAALRVGGVVIHFVPVYSYNGGYFSINPNALNDFYAANGFAELRSYVIMWDRYRPYAVRSRVYEYTAELAGRHALADHDQVRFSPHLLLFARKVEERPGIVVPIQWAPAPAARQRLLGRIARRALPDGLVTYVLAWARRELQLRRSRRRSFWI